MSHGMNRLLIIFGTTLIVAGLIWPWVNDYIGNNSPLTIHGVPNLSISMPKLFAQ